jgi:hypothetical protein
MMDQIAKTKNFAWAIETERRGKGEGKRQEAGKV